MDRLRARAEATPPESEEALKARIMRALRAAGYRGDAKPACDDDGPHAPARRRRKPPKANPERPIDPNTPLRLHDAVAAAFPHGGMTVSGLRREARRGRLVIEVVAGKQFVTLNEVERMRCHPDYQRFAAEIGTGKRPGMNNREQNATNVHERRQKTLKIQG
jgi:hypothetical protein